MSEGKECLVRPILEGDESLVPPGECYEVFQGSICVLFTLRKITVWLEERWNAYFLLQIIKERKCVNTSWKNVYVEY